jgi:hypothetical protein
VRKPEEKRPLGGIRRRWENNIKVDLMYDCRGVDWVHLAQDRDKWWAIVKVLINIWVI